MIENISKENFKRICKLNKKRYREENLDSFDIIIEGYRLIKQVLIFGLEIKAVYINLDNVNQFKDIAENPNFSVYFLSMSQAEQLSETKRSQGVFAEITFRTKPIINFNKLLYLNAIKDPGNLGVIYRTASAFDIDGIIIDEDCCDLSNDKVVRASMGAVFDVPTLKVDNTWIKTRKEELFISNISEDNGTSLNLFKFPDKPFILVLGSEAFGVAKYLSEQKHERVCIPMYGGMQSLNVATAAGIFMYKMRVDNG